MKLWLLRDIHREVLEALSEYLDGLLEPRAAARLEAHLERCPPCREELASLRATMAYLRALPQAPAPRSFRIPAHRALQPVGELAWYRLLPAFRLASAAAGLLLLLVIAADVLPAPARLESKVPAATALSKEPALPPIPAGALAPAPEATPPKSLFYDARPSEPAGSAAQDSAGAGKAAGQEENTPTLRAAPAAAPSPPQGAPSAPAPPALPPPPSTGAGETRGSALKGPEALLLALTVLLTGATMVLTVLGRTRSLQ